MMVILVIIMIQITNSPIYNKEKRVSENNTSPASIMGELASMVLRTPYIIHGCRPTSVVIHPN